MLTSEEIKRLEDFSVEQERQRRSDQQLWARLIELNDRQTEIVQLLPFTYRLAFSWRADCQSWRRYWHRLLVELDAHQPVIDAIVWHLERRGDGEIADWVSRNKEQQDQLAAKAQARAWRLNCD